MREKRIQKMGARGRQGFLLHLKQQKQCESIASVGNVNIVTPVTPWTRNAMQLKWDTDEICQLLQITKKFHNSIKSSF